MKKIKNLFFVMLIMVVLIASCTKEETDDRDKFIGTWKGTVNLIIPGIGNSSSSSTYIITKGTNLRQIIFTESEGTSTANVNGNEFNYDETTQSETIEGQTYFVKIDGSGYINGDVIKESGIFTIYLLGLEYPGTWSGLHWKEVNQ